MADWTVALVLLLISAILCFSFAVICRLFGAWRLSPPTISNEEKTRLTKYDAHSTGYMISHDEFSRTQMGSAGSPEGLPPPTEPVAESPTSETASVTSEHEVLGGGLQRAMSCDSVGSDSSILDVEPDAPRIGQLEFAVEYDREVSELVVSVIQARQLTPDHVTGTLNSYVKLWLTPHVEGRMQTQTVKGTTDPEYKERFLLNVEPGNLDGTTLQFQLFSSDKYARHKLHGETDLRLGDIDLRRPIRVWMNLRDMDERPTEVGDVMFSLSYLPTAERLTLVIVKARNLKWTHGKQAGDCFIKVYLLQNGKKISKKKTSTKCGDRNPIFNEAMIFSVPSTALQSVQLRVSVLEQQQSEDRVTSIGHVIVGSQLSGTELTHWNQMMTALRKPVAMWHRIQKQ